MTSTERTDGSILVVDDQQGVRQLVMRVLTHQGYTPIEAEGGERAVELCDGADSISMAIIDLTMPDMDGITLANKLREIRPQLPIVLMSGFDMDDVLASRPPINPAPSYLEKPFKIELLIQALETAEKNCQEYRESIGT